MAEYGWGLSPELVSKATTELNERPELVPVAIDAVREQMETRPDISELDTSVNIISNKNRDFKIFRGFE